MPRKRKRRYDPEATRLDILDAAEELFTARGHGDVSTAAIARAAGVSQSQIHYHFETKSKLYGEVFGRRFADYFAIQSALLAEPEMDGLDRLHFSMGAYFRFFQQHPGFAALMARAHLDAERLEQPMPGQLLSVGSAVIADAQSRGTVRDDLRPEYILISFLGMVSSWFLSREHHVSGTGLEGEPADHDEGYLDAILKIFLRGVAPLDQS